MFGPETAFLSDPHHDRIHPPPPPSPVYAKEKEKKKAAQEIGMSC